MQTREKSERTRVLWRTTYTTGISLLWASRTHNNRTGPIKGCHSFTLIDDECDSFNFYFGFFTSVTRVEATLVNWRNIAITLKTPYGAVWVNEC
jgi:hypothetical protein